MTSDPMLWRPVDPTDSDPDFAAPPRRASASARLRGLSKAVGAFLLDRLLPPQCAACGEPVGAPHTLCATCFRAMPFIAPPVCAILGVPFAYDIGESAQSPLARLAPPVYRRARAAARYDGPARVLVHRLKYADRHDCTVVMAKLIARAGKSIAEDADVIVPVPLHPFRLWQRRYNQSTLLARALGSTLDLPVDVDCLVRSRQTRPQVGLPETERRANVRDAFVVPRKAQARLEGRTIVLVDDVMTTGATVEACARSLMRAGAFAVDVLVFAKVVTETETLI